jgi:hypothetical protein
MVRLQHHSDKKKLKKFSQYKEGIRKAAQHAAEN